MLGVMRIWECIRITKASQFRMNQNIDIAAALGKPLWRTDSFIPRYRVGEVGSWRINPGGQLVNDWGYFTGPCLLEMLPS